MKKRIIAAVVLSLFLIGITILITTASDNATTSEANIPSETSTEEATLTAGVTAKMSSILSEAWDTEPYEIEATDTLTVGSSIELQAEEHERIETNDIDELKSLVAECTSRMEAATTMAESGKALGYEDDDPVLILAQQEYDNAESDLEYYQELLDAAKWAKKVAEYPEACQVWKYLTETMGLNDHVAAGILGNMMAEVGGQTLDLQIDCCERGYYGICQWRRVYMIYDITGGSLATQLDYLNSTIQDEFSVFGKLYSSGFDYEDFCNLDNEQTAAIAFAIVYERCGSGSYSVRKQNAITAYEYFTE